jgi:hypothetical protein
MRFVLLALMIALLPLRSWAGDVMALEMAQPQLIATETGYDSSHCLDRVHADLGVQVATGDIQDSAQDHCNTCTSCQVCHSVAMASEVQWPVARQLPHYVPMPSTAAFTSAAPAPGFKPPIS